MSTVARPYRGNAEGTLDAKGRAAVPTRFRPIFEGREELVLWEPQGSKQPYLILMLDEYFDKIVEREYDGADELEEQDLTHDIWGHMDYVELDSASRFPIDKKYYKKAGFERGEKLFFIANQSYMEVWPLKAWERHEEERRGERSRLRYTPGKTVEKPQPHPLAKFVFPPEEGGADE